MSPCRWICVRQCGGSQLWHSSRSPVPAPFHGKKQALVVVFDARSSRAAGDRLWPVLDDRLGDVGVEREQARVHPRLRVPEDQARVVVAAQAGRRDAVVIAGADARLQRVEVRADPLLKLGAPGDDDVARPEVGPGGGVAREAAWPSRRSPPAERRRSPTAAGVDEVSAVSTPTNFVNSYERAAARIERERLAGGEVLRRRCARDATSASRRSSASRRPRRPSRSWCGTRRRRSASP